MSARFTDEQVMAAFLARVDKSGGADACWPWLGADDGQSGRGRFSIHGKSTSAPKAAWLLLRGAIPNGLWVLHTCDNPPCVNLAHLYLGTHADNVRDAGERRRRAVGLRCGSHKVTPEIVRAMRSEYKPRDKEWSGRRLAAKYVVGQNCAAKILRGETWKEVV